VRWAAGEHAKGGGPITLVPVISTSAVAEASETGLRLRIARWQKTQAHRVVDDAQRILASCIGGDGSAEVSTKLSWNRPLSALIDASRDARLIVVGSRGMDAQGRFLLGSVRSGLMHHAHCPVAAVHEEDDVTTICDVHAPVLLGVDGSPASELATSLAFDTAARCGVGLLALHAWSGVGVFPILGMDWRTNRDQGGEVLGEAWPDGNSTTPRSRWSACCSATSQPDGSSRNLPALSSLSSVATAEVASPGCFGVGQFGGRSIGADTRRHRAKR
jgi:nucleotide-binding universal stress UspA family protein